MAEPHCIDGRALERLKEWGGQALPRQMLEIFLENAPDRIEQIRRGVEEGDLHLAETGAHSLKSSAGNVGAMRVQDLCQAMEALAEAGDLGKVAELLPDLQKAHGEARTELEGILEGMDE